MPHSLHSRLRLWVSDPRFAGRVFWVAVVVAAFSWFRWLHDVPTQPVTDFAWYFDRAAEMAGGLDYQVDGKATAYWPVGYPGFLSLLFRITGPSVDAARAMNALLSTLVVLLSGLVVLRTTPNRWIAVAVMAILAFHPAWIAYGGILASEPLYTALTLLGIWQFPSHRNGNVVLSGLAFGLAALVRPQAILIPIVLSVVSFWLSLPKPPSRQAKGTESADRNQFPPARQGGDRGVHEKPEAEKPTKQDERRSWSSLNIKRLRLLPSFILLLSIAMIPPLVWSARNINAVGGFAFVSTNGGDNLWIGATGDGRYKSPLVFSNNELEQDKRAREEGTRIIRASPVKWLALAPEKLRQTFLSGTDAPYWAFQTRAGELITPGAGNDKEQFKSFQARSNAWPPVLVAFAILGLFIRPKSEKYQVNLTVSIVVITLTAVLSIVFFGNPRFGLPATPFLALLAVLPFVRMAESLVETPIKQDGGSQNDDLSPTIS